MARGKRDAASYSPGCSNGALGHLVLEPLAAAESVLTDDDKEYGCAIVNMGAEITSLIIFGRGAVQHTAVFPFGSMLFTKDIATGLRVSIPEANKIKHNWGCVASFLIDDEDIPILELNKIEFAGTEAAGAVN